jgi:hypothetical protein
MAEARKPERISVLGRSQRLRKENGKSKGKGKRAKGKGQRAEEEERPYRDLGELL